MKKPYTTVLLLVIAALLCFPSCQMADDASGIPTYGDNASNRGREGEYLVAVSRIRGIRDSIPSRGFDEDGEWEEGEDIVGVLLAFHNGKSTKIDENGYLKDDPYAFYIEELDHIGHNGDGMAYNYILYIPSVIQDVYRDAGGVNPYSGNPFWWYMKTYLNMSLPQIVDDYEDVIDFLLRNGKRLPYPKAKDVVGNWSSSYASLKIRQAYHVSNYPDSANMSQIGFWYDTESNTLWMPSAITGEYTAGGGSFNSRDALDWYISTYMKDETAGFDSPNEFIKSESFKSIIESMDFSNPDYMPSGKDLDVSFTEQMDDEFDDDAEKISLNHCSFYYDGMIRDDDGNPIADGKIHVLSEGVWQNGYEGVAVYFPEKLKEEYESEKGRYRYNGDLFWWFIQKYHGVSDETVFRYRHDACSMPAERMKGYVTVPDAPLPPEEPLPPEKVPEAPEGLEEIHHYPDNSRNEITGGKITVISDIREVTTVDGIVYINNAKPDILLEFGAPEGKPDGAFYLPVPDNESLNKGRYHFYVPSMIRDAYIEGNGKNPNSGNPLWWYLKTYYNVSLNDVRYSLVNLFDVLLESGDGLIMPDSKDVNDSWMQSSDNALKFKLVRTLRQYPENTMDRMGIYFDKKENTIYLPAAISGEYEAAGMTGHPAKALHWYLKQYHSYSSDEEINSILASDNAPEILKALDYESNPPFGKKITEEPVTRVNDEFLGNNSEYFFSHAAFYYPGRLLDKDGNPINDGKIHIDTDQNGYMTLYFPESIKIEQEMDRGHFYYNGNLLWDFIMKHHGVSGDETKAIKDNGFRIPKDKIIEWMVIPE